MASLTTSALCISNMAAAAPRRRSLTVARATAKSPDHQEPAIKADGGAYAGGRRQAITLFATAVTASTVVGRYARADGVSKMTGQWQEIENVEDPYVQDLAKWALSENYRQTGKELHYDKVVSGMQQVVAGMNYSLKIKTKGPAGSYEAGLFVSLPPEKRQLNSSTALGA